MLYFAKNDERKSANTEKSETPIIAELLVANLKKIMLNRRLLYILENVQLHTEKKLEIDNNICNMKSVVVSSVRLLNLWQKGY